MSNKSFGYSDVINLLIKRAKGFYYTEEQLEYEKTQKNKIIDKNNGQFCENISFFDNTVRGKEELINSCDTIKASNKTTTESSNESLTLVKKKVSTHYISPDMLAIKILFEIFKEKVTSNEIENMSDEELLNLKNELLKELKDET